MRNDGASRPGRPSRKSGIGATGHGVPTIGGLEWIGARAYDPVSRGFLSTEPLAPVTGAGWAGNPYAYAGAPYVHAGNGISDDRRNVTKTAGDVWLTRVLKVPEMPAHSIAIGSFHWGMVSSIGKTGELPQDRNGEEQEMTPQRPLNSDHRSTRRGQGNLMKGFLLVVSVTAAVSSIAYVRGVISGEVKYGPVFVISSALFAMLIFCLFLIGVFIRLRRISEGRENTLLNAMPGALSLGRTVHAATTETAIRQLGGVPSLRPGTEILVAALGPQEFRIVRGNGNLILSLPTQSIQSVTISVSEMITGGPRETLILAIHGREGNTIHLPLLLTRTDRVFPRDLSPSELMTKAQAASNVLSANPPK